jgi:LacI family transcriptional regulator
MKKHRVTSGQVAERAGVSRTAVSFVLNGLDTNKVSDATRRRVLAVAAELGYVPNAAARALVSGKTATIGLVVSQADHIRVDAFVPQTLHSLARICSAFGYRLLVETSDPGQPTYEYDQLVDAKQIDGLVVLNPDPTDVRLRRLIDDGYPLVMIGGHPHPSASAVWVDSVAAMDTATTHLIDHGHDQIAFIHYRHIPQYSIGGRFGGYRSALNKADIRFDEALVRSGDYSADSGYCAMTSLLDSGQEFSAVVAGNDTIAMGAMAAIVESGRHVPADIAVVGFDDIPLARYAVPSLTTVRLPAADMAATCGEMIIELITKGSLRENKRAFQAELVVRHSCGVLRVGERPAR